MGALESGCTGKHPYESAIRAWRVVKRHKRMYGRRYCTMLGVYRCRRYRAPLPPGYSVRAAGYALDDGLNMAQLIRLFRAVRGEHFVRDQ